MIRAVRPLLGFLTSLSVIAFLSLASGCGSHSTPGVASTGGGSGSGTGGSGSGGSGGGSGAGSGGSSGPSGNSTGNSAFVYVSGNNAIQGYVASASGALTPIAGSPFAASGIGPLAATSQNLFGAENSQSIASFSIASDGAIAPISSINAQQLNTYPTDGGPLSLFTDAMDETVYDNDIYADGANHRYQAFMINSDGSLRYSGVTSYGDTQQYVLSFTGNDAYAYGSDCYHSNDEIYGFMRNANGTLTYFDPKANLPTPPSGVGYCTEGTAVSQDNHVVIALGESPDGYQVGNSQLAVYTINSDGTLTTTGTTATMPTDKVGMVNDYRFDPAGANLAVAGQSGVQVYAYSSGTLTAEGGPLTTDPINKVEWDSSGHLYALSQTTGKLYVFSIANGSGTAASGSPYAIASPSDLAVAPLS